MGQINPTLPTAGNTLNSIADPELITALTQILSVINGGIDGTNLSALLAQSAGVNQAGQVVKAPVNIPGSDSRTNTAYGTMPTPDQVASVVLPTNGLLLVSYEALWQESVTNAARAAIFIGANQYQARTVNNSNTGVVTVAAYHGGTAATNVGLSSAGVYGIASAPLAGGAEVTTGQGIGIIQDSFNASTLELNGLTVGNLFPSFGAPVPIFAAAGTYTISVRFKASSGSVTASNRQLWVQAISFS